MMSNLISKYTIILFLLIKLVLIKKCNGFCYFPSELQGLYVTQGVVDRANQIHYSEINVIEDAIPIWGSCHEKTDNNIILKMEANETTCYRCFNIKLVSRNVIRVITTDKNFISRCYAEETEARETCPNQPNRLNNNFIETLLYKKLDFLGLSVHEFCPINGRYTFNYTKTEGRKNSQSCKSLESTLDNCPSGSAMNLRFKKCSFQNQELTFECIGHWESYNKEKYMVFIDKAAEKSGIGPIYRCATYKEYVDGTINLRFSRDSTCDAIYSYQDQNDEIEYSEIMQLNPNEIFTWPDLKYCTFPDWMQGGWQHITVHNDTIIYRDQSSYKAYTIKCVEKLLNFNKTGNIVVYSRSQCGEESYFCLKIKNRSVNILEFKITQQFSKDYTANICEEYYFKDVLWVTQGRLNLQYQYSPCPVSGEFIGVIPDLPSLCTKLSSECSSEDIMHYQVSDCGFNQIYEERKYRCLGQWSDDDIVYAYAQRLDIDTYECFVGARVDEKRIYIKEAGESCQRHLKPLKHGMEINKIGYCEDLKKTIKYYDHYEGPMSISITTNYNSPETGRGVVLSSEPSFEAIQRLHQDSHHYNLNTGLGDKISIPSEVVISKLSEKNKQLLEEHLLLATLSNLNETTSTTLSTTDSTLSIAEIEDENEVDKRYDSYHNNTNKNITEIINKDCHCGTNTIVLNLSLSLAILGTYLCVL